MVPFSVRNAPSLRGGDAFALKGIEETAVRLCRPQKRYSAWKKESRKESPRGPLYAYGGCTAWSKYQGQSGRQLLMGNHRHAVGGRDSSASFSRSVETGPPPFVQLTVSSVLTRGYCGVRAQRAKELSSPTSTALRPSSFIHLLPPIATILQLFLSNSSEFLITSLGNLVQQPSLS
jgi:hypothetical protein